MNTRWKEFPGLAMIETLLAITVLSIGLMGTMLTLALSFTVKQQAVRRAEVRRELMNRLEELRWSIGSITDCDTVSNQGEDRLAIHGSSYFIDWTISPARVDALGPTSSLLQLSVTARISDSTMIYDSLSVLAPCSGAVRD